MPLCTFSTLVSTCVGLRLAWLVWERIFVVSAGSLGVAWGIKGLLRACWNLQRLISIIGGALVGLEALMIMLVQLSNRGLSCIST